MIELHYLPYRAIQLDQPNAQYIHPEPLLFNWAEADSLLSFCQNNNKRLHGHTLIWHQQLPQWILDYQGSTSDWEQFVIFRFNQFYLFLPIQINAYLQISRLKQIILSLI